MRGARIRPVPMSRARDPVIPPRRADAPPGSAAAARTAPRFRFRGIGPVREAELELGDLTLIAGRNNTGKTYLAYTLYGFLKLWANPETAVRVLETAAGTKTAGAPGPHTGPARSEALRLLERALAQGTARWELSPEELAEHRRRVMEVLSAEFSRDALPSVFSTSPDALPGASFECHPADTLSEDTMDMGLLLHGESWSFRYDGSAAVIERVKASGASRSSGLLDLARTWLLLLFPELHIEPFVLSAERLGISLFYRELDFTKNQLFDLIQKLGDRQARENISPYLIIDRTASRYTMPIKDNIDFTRGIPDLASRKSAFQEAGIHNRIRDMLGGYFHTDDGMIRLRSRARGEEAFDIPLHLASSSARGLSDFYFFLKQPAKESRLLIIDEPETHLDTANQVRLARLLSQLAQSGLRILITTHSDYLVKELNNLIMLHAVDGEDLDYAKDDALDPGRVRAYTAEGGSLTPCSIDQYGMELPVFDTMIEDINRVSNALATRVRAQRRAS